MKTVISTFAALFAATTLKATPTVSGVSVTEAADKTIEVSYTLSEKAIITVDFQLGGVSIGEEKFADLAGDVNRVVNAGSCKIFWNPAYVPSLNGTNGNLTAVVKAWTLASPPDYMVWTMDENMPGRAIRFYTSTNALPDGGLSNDVYSRYRLVMKRIHAAGIEWRMGTTGTQRAYTGGDQLRQWPHYVKLTKDYYMSIYNLTQRQVRNVMGWPRNPSPYNNNDQAATESYPHNNIAFTEIRGSTDGLLWPALSESEAYAHKVDSGSLIAALRERSGISTIDLPTRAQFEFAQRAGRGTLYYNGSDTVTADMSNTTFAWVDASGPQAVGKLPPNDYGLYDMNGNLLTWALDINWRSTGRLNNALEIDPRGTDAATGERSLVGGFYSGTLTGCAYCGYATSLGATRNGATSGVRVVCDVDMTTDLGGL